MPPEPRDTGHDDLLAELSAELNQAARRVVPRFLETMPPAYFHDTDHATRLEHLRALVAAEAGGLPQDLTLRSTDGRRITFIRETSYPGLLAELVERLPADPPLSSAKVHTATDNRLILDTFELGEPEVCDPGDPAQAAAIARTLEVLTTHGNLPAEDLRTHLHGCTRDYVRLVPPERVAGHYRLLERMRADDLCTVADEPVPGTPLVRISLATPGREGRDLFARIAAYLGRLGVDIHRGHVDLFRRDNAVAAIVTVHVAVPDTLTQSGVSEDLTRLRYLDQSALDLWHALPDLTLVESEMLTALGRLAHQKLSAIDRLAYTRERIASAIRAESEHATAIVRHLLARIRPHDAPPPLPDCSEIREESTATVLATLAELAGHVLRSNCTVSRRRALALRLTGDALPRGTGETPFGVFFVHGRGFDGFHVRFRDIARGGVRIVRPAGPEQFALESERLYEEAYNLAWAQQLKNKDIPEGGAKGVILTEPDRAPEPAARAYTDALLDLVAPDPRTRSFIFPPAEQPELLYLGPDEKITNEIIDWIVNRARQRGYPLPAAFMSSKPDAGINHKQYGVTSEGVTVFLDVALRELGIDPHATPFTVTLTGGPDGDVAGNEIRILQREYGDNARIIGIADGSGSAEDPAGLDAAELLRLVEAEQPIARFDTARLGPEGRVTPLDAPDGPLRRNTLHTRLPADAFIPAGGRPATLNADNWSAFVRDDGTPASRLIVEGANLFLTPEARLALSERGVLIVKDSSANKCGVICSSLEILACMLFDDAGFLAIKPRFVPEVLAKLRELARLEATALFREHRSRPHLPHAAAQRTTQPGDQPRHRRARRTDSPDPRRQPGRPADAPVRTSAAGPVRRATRGATGRPAADVRRSSARVAAGRAHRLPRGTDAGREDGRPRPGPTRHAVPAPGIPDRAPRRHGRGLRLARPRADRPPAPRRRHRRGTPPRPRPCRSPRSPVRSRNLKPPGGVPAKV